MADQAVKHSPYVRDSLESDFRRLKNILRCVVSVPKEAIDKAIEDEAAQKRQDKESAKNG